MVVLSMTLRPLGLHHPNYKMIALINRWLGVVKYIDIIYSLFHRINDSKQHQHKINIKEKKCKHSHD